MSIHSETVLLLAVALSAVAGCSDPLTSVGLESQRTARVSDTGTEPDHTQLDEPVAPASEGITGVWAGFVEVDGRQLATGYRLEATHDGALGIGTAEIDCPAELFADPCAWTYAATLIGKRTLAVSYGPDCALLIGPSFDESMDFDCPDDTEFTWDGVHRITGTFMGQPMDLRR